MYFSGSLNFFLLAQRARSSSRRRGLDDDELTANPLSSYYNTFPSPVSPHPPYPPLEQTWARLRRWLAREYPELGDTLNYGILPQDLADVEMALGAALPPAVRESYLLVDGQEAESAAGCSDGLFMGLRHVPIVKYVSY